MPLFLLIVGVSLLVAGCAGSQTVTVTVNHVSQVEVQQIAEEYEKRPIQTRLRGYTIWKETPFGTEGHISIIPAEQFESLEKYHEILGHELDHVLRGAYHPAWE